MVLIKDVLFIDFVSFYVNFSNFLCRTIDSCRLVRLSRSIFLHCGTFEYGTRVPSLTQARWYTSQYHGGSVHSLLCPSSYFFLCPWRGRHEALAAVIPMTHRRRRRRRPCTLRRMNTKLIPREYLAELPS